MKKTTRIVSILLVLVTCLGVFSPMASAAVVKKGSSGTLVRQVQYNLNALGFSVGSVDGIAGNNTVNAIKNYQKSRGLEVDGMAGPATQSALWREIKDIQNLLKKHGFYSDSIDSIAGPNTIAGIKKFQKAAGLKQSGVADSTTVKKLKAWVPNTTKNTSTTANTANTAAPSGNMKKYADGGYTNYYVVKGYNKAYRYDQFDYDRYIVDGRNQGCSAVSACMVLSMAKGKVVSPKSYPWYSDGCHWENMSSIKSEGSSTKLSQIVGQLKKGRAIALWANEWHCVCVIGYRADANMSKLKASDLLIVDPATGGVTTLNNAQRGGYAYTNYRMYYAAGY